MNTNQFLDYFYEETDLVCLFFNPLFEGRRQRFAYVAQLKEPRFQRFLNVVNARGSNVYLSVYPFQGRKRTEESVVDEVDRVYLDFDEEPPYLAFRADYIPACTILTSPGKYQCFLKFQAPVAKEQAKAVSRGLAAKYGADHTFDLSRVFRLPGFLNLKYLEKPLARVIEVNHDQVYSIQELPIFIEEPKPPLTAFNLKVPSQKKQTRYGYEHFLQGAPRKVNGDPDFSSADFSYCIYLFSHGFDDSEARAALKNYSPSISKRKGGGLENYLNKTIGRAMEYQRRHDNQLAAVG